MRDLPFFVVAQMTRSALSYDLSTETKSRAESIFERRSARISPIRQPVTAANAEA